jgi:hypothetical protein
MTMKRRNSPSPGAVIARADADIGADLFLGRRIQAPIFTFSLPATNFSAPRKQAE